MGLAVGRWRLRPAGCDDHFFGISHLGLVRCGDERPALLPCALAVLGKWVPIPWWRPLAILGAGLSLFVMLMFFDAKKVLPIALDVFVLWAAWTNVEIAR